MDRSGISWLLLVFIFGSLMFLMVHEHRYLSNSIEKRRLHLARSLREANMPQEQIRALTDAIDGVAQDARDSSSVGFPLMAIFIAMTVADTYDLQRRLKKLESKAQQPSPAFQTDAGDP